MNFNRIRPFTGMVLVELCKPEKQTNGGLFLPDPKKPKLETAIVRRIGPWRKTKQGLAIVPEFHIGDTVVIANESGVKLRGDPAQMLKIVSVDKVRAVFTSD